MCSATAGSYRGVIYELGKAHHIVIPYVDETLPHEPRFGISSFGGKAIREWAGEIYDGIIEAKKWSGLDIDTKDISHGVTNVYNGVETVKSISTQRSGAPITVGRTVTIVKH